MAVTDLKTIQSTVSAMEATFTASLTGKNVPTKRFIATANHALAAIAPATLAKITDKTSIFIAIGQAAQEGLVLDGREAALVPYGGKMQYRSMVYGLIKLCAKRNIQVDSEVVYEGDEWDYSKGDKPFILHKPKKNISKADRKLIATYAIFRDLERNGMVIHRAIMEGTDIEEVKSVAQSKNIWDKWPAEMWKKSVIRRGYKSVPALEGIEAIVNMDNDVILDAPTPVTEPPTPTAKTETKASQIVKEKVKPIDAEVVDKSTATPIDPPEKKEEELI